MKFTNRFETRFGWPRGASKEDLDLARTIGKVVVGDMQGATTELQKRQQKRRL